MVECGAVQTDTAVVVFLDNGSGAVMTRILLGRVPVKPVFHDYSPVFSQVAELLGQSAHDKSILFHATLDVAFNELFHLLSFLNNFLNPPFIPIYLFLGLTFQIAKPNKV